MSCGATELRTFYRVTSIPVHSCLLMERQGQALAFPRGDLELGFCEQCGFIQNSLFDPCCSDYADLHEETQAFSPRFRRFIDELCDRQIRKYGLAGKKFSRSGAVKESFWSHCASVAAARGIGIDPAYRPERTVSASVPSGEIHCRSLWRTYGHLEATNLLPATLEHIPNVAEIPACSAAKLDGRQLGDLSCSSCRTPDACLAERAFWDIYYEHCSYFTLGSLARPVSALRHSR